VAGYLVIASFLGLFLLGFPVVLAIGLPCLVYLFANGIPADMVAQRMLYSLDSFPLIAVPVFLFVGSIMNCSGISHYIYKFADTAVGRLPGGLAQVNICNARKRFQCAVCMCSHMLFSHHWTHIPP